MRPSTTRCEIHKRRDIRKQAPGQSRLAEWVGYLYDGYDVLLHTAKGGTRKEVRQKLKAAKANLPDDDWSRN